MKDIVDMAANRGKLIDQSQCLNLFVANSKDNKLTAVHFYLWKKGLETGIYYLLTKAAIYAIQYTVYNSKGIKQNPSDKKEYLGCQG